MQIGDFIDGPSLASPLFTLEMTLQAQDFQTEWKRCSMLANYIAEYVAYQFSQRERAENLISIIANELLEAMVHLAPTGSGLSIRCMQLENGLRIDTEHLVRVEAFPFYVDLLRKLNRSECEESFYYDLLTSEKRDQEQFNQFGLAMLSHDFGVRMAAD